MTNIKSDAQFADATYAKVSWRIIPLLFLCYIVAYLDRVNVGFAKLQMLSDLHFSETVYGLGAGIFFIGYFLFEIPSNIVLHKIGARIWIARIMLTWGLISGAMMWVSTPEMFYVMRFLLGLAEAGFFPGIILYLTYWYPADRRGRMTTLFMTAVPLSGVVGGPLSGWIMQALSGFGGYQGWQWMFLIEAIPSLILGLAVILFLKDSVADAKWLSPEEKKLLHSQIHQDSVEKQDHSLKQVLTSPRLWLLAAIYFCFVMGLYGISFWLPTIIKATGIQGNLTIGLLSAIPYLFAVLSMVLTSRSADSRRERRWHVAIPGIMGGIGLVLSAAYSQDTVLAMAALCLATMGILTTLPLFWSLPTAYLRGTAAAAGIALINSLGNLAGFVSPYLVGWIKDMTQSTDSAMLLLAGAMAIGAVLTLSVPARLVNR